MIGVELECTMLSADAGHASTDPWSPYGVRTSLDRSAFLVDLAEAAERAGLPVEQIHTEYGHDQLEVSLAPSTPVAAVDTVAAARIVIGRAAARHGLRISFSPVPFEGEAGNGAHLHLSLADAEGPLLSGGDGPHGMRPAGGSATAGVLQALPDLLGVYAGSVLSSARLKPGNWAGAAQCWGLENREAAVRFVAATPGTPHGANIECKLIDPSANPYLAAVSFIGSALRGIDKGLELPYRSAQGSVQGGQPTTDAADRSADGDHGARDLADRRRAAVPFGDRGAGRGPAPRDHHLRRPAAGRNHPGASPGVELLTTEIPEEGDGDDH